MRLGTVSFRTKLLASYVALVAAVELITILVLNQSLGADLVQRLDERLEEQAIGAAAWVSARHEQHGERSIEGSSDRQATRLAGVVHAWVTIIDEHGVVAGDSERRRPGPIGGPGAVGMEPELGAGDAPEVLAARGGKVGRATRRPKGHGEEMHFVAVPAESGEVVRLGVPLAEIETTIRSMRNRLLAASALAFVGALGLGFLAARLIVRPLRAMTTSASRIAQGDYEIEVPRSAEDEFGTLARSLASLAAQLKARIGELTDERDRLSAILAGMVEGVVVLGSDRAVLVANPSAVEILGAGQGGLVGRTVAEAFRDPTLRGILEEAGAQRLLREVEVEVAEPGGDRRALIINVQPLSSLAGGGVVAVLHDVTQLRRLQGMRREFVANVSHELRTPVAAIQGYAETLLQTGDPIDEPTRKEFLEVIHRHARRIGRLVEDLLRLSDIEARAPGNVTREAVRIDDLAANVCETVRNRLAERKIMISVDVTEDAVAFGDPDGLEQVLDNLVDNAIKYGRPSGRVAITGRRQAERILITIEDDGPGIAPEHLPRIFERFYRVDAGRSRAHGGTGLGLAIVRRLLESMGGSIVAESVVGKGSRFLVQLPGA